MKKEEEKEGKESQSDRDNGAPEQTCALGARWGLEWRWSQALEPGSLGTVGSQEGMRSSVFGSQNLAACRRWMTGPITRPSLNPHASQLPPHQGKGLFSCPLALGSAVQLALANVPDA